MKREGSLAETIKPQESKPAERDSSSNDSDDEDEDDEEDMDADDDAVSIVHSIAMLVVPIVCFHHLTFLHRTGSKVCGIDLSVYTATFC